MVQNICHSVQNLSHNYDYEHKWTTVWYQNPKPATLGCTIKKTYFYQQKLLTQSYLTKYNLFCNYK